jgi:Zn-dependent peptidase ImmA (M78 family)
LSGDTQPTFRQLEEFAQATSTPFGMLFLDTPPEEKLPIPNYRTLDDKAVPRPSADLLDTIYTMQMRQDWMRDYLIDCGASPLPFVRSVAPGEDARSVATRIREVLGFGEDWAGGYRTWDEALAALRDAIENAGILFFSNGVVGNDTHRVLDPDEFRGFVLVDDYAPLVFVNAADPKVAQMFTIAHEVAHVFYGVSAAFDLREMSPASARTELECNGVAAEFLVPESRLRSAWPFVRDDAQRFYKLARQFKVSTIVVARRLRDLRLISADEFRDFYLAQMAHERTESAKGGSFHSNQPNRVGRRFGAAVVHALRSGRVTYTEAYSLTGLRGGSFDHFAAGVEI